jgi:glutamate-1-semialdehyde 2,1-aminomutase
MTQTKFDTYVTDALATARLEYAKRNHGSANLQTEGAAYMPGGNTRTILHVLPFPITFASGDGASLTSVDGDTYLDFLGEYSAGIFGHSNKAIKDTVTAAMSKGWNFGGQCTYEKVLAKKVVERFYESGLELVRFTNSGTESNTMAIAAALNFTGRKKVLVFTGGYHGGTLIFSAEYIQQPNVPSSNLPHDFVFAPYNNINETRKVLDDLPPNTLAAVLLEPLQGSGGCRPASPEFLHFLRRQTTRLGALFIVDEVMASRLGPHGYCATVGIRPDLITFGKYIGGGMTFGAFGGRKDIMSLFDPSKSSLQHPGTYNNNIVTMAAGIAGLDIYDAGAVEALNARGHDMKIKLQEIFIRAGLYPEHPAGASRDILEIDSLKGPTTVLDETGSSATQKPLPKMFVSGEGSMLNIRFSGVNRASWQGLFYHHMLQRNIYLAARGYTPLHLALTDRDVDQYVAAVDEFVKVHREALLSYY